jgi:GGDEF domain-containing protein
MPHAISERSARMLLDLFPTAQGRPDAQTWLVDQLVDAELHRRGAPDLVSGAFHALALNQGSLLKEEFDLGTHGHHDGWTIGALLVDPLEFMLFDMRYGFEAGDRALRAMVDAMRSVCPRAKVVRTHTDGFAVLLGPTAEQQVSDALLEPLRKALTERVAAVTPEGGEVRTVAYTLGALELTVVDPPNWQLLGPLVWAECERAHLVFRRTKQRAMLKRRVVLDGRLPVFDE